MGDLGATMSERNPAGGQLEKTQIQYMTINGFIVLVIDSASNVEPHKHARCPLLAC